MQSPHAKAWDARWETLIFPFFSQRPPILRPRFESVPTSSQFTCSPRFPPNFITLGPVRSCSPSLPPNFITVVPVVPPFSQLSSHFVRSPNLPPNLITVGPRVPPFSQASSHFSFVLPSRLPSLLSAFVGSPTCPPGGDTGDQPIPAQRSGTGDQSIPAQPSSSCSWRPTVSTHTKKPNDLPPIYKNNQQQQHTTSTSTAPHLMPHHEGSPSPLRAPALTPVRPLPTILPKQLVRPSTTNLPKQLARPPKTIPSKIFAPAWTHNSRRGGRGPSAVAAPAEG